MSKDMMDKCFLFLLVLTLKLLEALTVSASSAQHLESYSHVKSLEALANGSWQSTANETLQLIIHGEKQLLLNGTRNHDFILVAGLSGSGKTTITKFVINQDNDMESYHNHRYLIRDKAGKISTQSIVSVTSIPELMIDSQSSTHFFDLPGFKDTRSITQEIANSYFIHRVVTHARGLKFVFVINHSALRPGEDRHYFLSLMDHALRLIQSPLKYQNAFALVASKVEANSSTTNPQIISNIAQFLTEVKVGLSQISSTSGEEYMRRMEFVNAFLNTTISNGHQVLSKIGIFRQPDRVGPLSEIPIVQSTKPWLRQVLLKNTEFVSTSENDFGFPISNDARLVAGYMRSAIERSIVDKVIQFMNREVVSKLNRAVPSSDGLCGVFANFNFYLSKLNTGTTFPSLAQDFSSLFTTIQSLTSENEKGKFESSLQMERNMLIFLDKISQGPQPASKRPWWTALEEVKELFLAEVDILRQNAMPEIHNNWNSMLIETLATYKERYNASLPRFQTQSARRRAIAWLESDVQKLAKLQSYVEGLEPNFNLIQLFKFALPIFKNLTIVKDVTTEQWVDCENIWIRNSKDVSVSLWAWPIQQNLMVLKTISKNLETLNREEARRAEQEGQLSKIRNLNSEIQRNRLESAKAISNLKETIDIMTRNFTRELSQLQSQLRDEDVKGREDRINRETFSSMRSEAFSAAKKKDLEEYAEMERSIRQNAGESIREMQKAVDANALTRAAAYRDAEEQLVELIQERRAFALRNRWIASLFTNKDHSGSALNVASAGFSCLRLGGQWDSEISSINTYGTCVRMFFSYDCTGRYKKIQPGSPCHSDFSNCSFNDQFSSIGPCNDPPEWHHEEVL